MYTIDSHKKKSKKSKHSRIVKIISPYSSLSKPKAFAISNRENKERYSSDVAAQPVYFVPSNFHQAIRSIREKAAEILGDDLFFNVSFEQDDQLLHISIYNDKLSPEENHKRFKKFDEWWLAEGIYQYDDVVVHLRWERV